MNKKTKKTKNTRINKNIILLCFIFRNLFLFYLFFFCFFKVPTSIMMSRLSWAPMGSAFFCHVLSWLGVVTSNTFLSVIMIYMNYITTAFRDESSITTRAVHACYTLKIGYWFTAWSVEGTRSKKQSILSILVGARNTIWYVYLRSGALNWYFLLLFYIIINILIRNHIIAER